MHLTWPTFPEIEKNFGFDRRILCHAVPGRPKNGRRDALNDALASASDSPPATRSAITGRALAGTFTRTSVSGFLTVVSNRLLCHAMIVKSAPGADLDSIPLRASATY